MFNRKPDNVYVVKVWGEYVSIEKEDGGQLNDGQMEHVAKALSKKRAHYVYFAYGYNKDLSRWCHKIGVTNDVYRRMEQLGFNCIHHIKTTGSETHLYESIAHGHFIENGKWLGGEYFDLSDKDIEVIKALNTTKDIEENLKTILPWWDRTSFRTDISLYRSHYIFGITYGEWREQFYPPFFNSPQKSVQPEEIN